MATRLPQAKNRAIIDALDQEILRNYLEVDDTGNFVNPPSDDDELHEFIRLSIGISIPRKVLIPGHRAPFEFIADMFFERVDNALVFANRNGGKTYDIAILNLLDLIFKPGCEIASAGAVKDQAKKCYSYLQEFMAEEWFRDFCHQYLRKTGRTFVTKEIQEETSFRTKSKLQILTATKKGVRGPHPNKARIDEIDEVDWDILQTFLSMARSSNGIRGQNLFSSTRQYERGTMQRLLEEAIEKGITVYEWNIWETVERCTRRCFNDPKHGDCPVYVHCRGRAHSADGFYAINDFVGKLKLLDQEAWDTEWENKKPAKHKLVYGGAFNESRHIMTAEKLKEMTGVPFVTVDWPRISGIDFGGGPGHPFVYLKFCQLPNGAWLLFFEYVAEQRLMRDHANVVKNSPWWHRHEWSYSDHARQDRLELKEKGVLTKAANKEVKMGIDHVRELLNGYPPNLDPMLYIWWQCSYTIMEFGLYSWPVGPDGTVVKDGNPEKKHDHCLVGETEVCIEGLGWVPIEKAPATGRILTPEGFATYLNPRITRRASPVVRVVFDDGFSARMTDDHLIRVDSSQYVPIGRLVGCEVQQIYHHTLQEKTTRIESVEYDGVEDVWCLDVPGVHCFLLRNGVVSHNCMDALRYALYSLKERPKRRYRTRKVPGV